MQWDVLNLLVILYISDTQYCFAYFTVKTKVYKVIIFMLFSYDCSLKLSFVFVRLILLSHTKLQSWGRFLWATRYKKKSHRLNEMLQIISIG